MDVSDDVGLDFRHVSSSTSQKYLPETMGSGVALFDYDGDGRLDIFFANGARIDDPMPAGALPVKDGPRYWNRLYRQKPDGRFEDVTATAGLAGTGYGQGVAVGDYDNDGDEDLYVAGVFANQLYRNEGDGRFADVTAEAGVGGGGWSSSVAFVDFDNDGRLDLFAGRYMEWSFAYNPHCSAAYNPFPEQSPNGPRAYCHPNLFKGATALLYRNEGGGRFRDVSKEAGVANPGGKSLGVAMADFDGDGLTDLFVANDAVQQFLYRNLGNGRFEDVALGAFAAFDQDGKAFSGMGTDVADYDNDGRPDVVVTNLANQCYALYRNLGDLSFSYETHASGLGRISLLSSGWGVRFLDYDNDGWKDLFLVQGHVLDTIELTSPHLRYRQPPLLAAQRVGSLPGRLGRRGRRLSHGVGGPGAGDRGHRRRRRPRHRGEHARRPRPRAPQRGRQRRPLGRAAARGPAQQPRRHRGRGPAHHGLGPGAPGHGTDRGRLPFGRRPPRAPRPGGGGCGSVDRDPLAERDGPAPDRRGRGPDPHGHRAVVRQRPCPCVQAIEATTFVSSGRGRRAMLGCPGAWRHR